MPAWSSTRRRAAAWAAALTVLVAALGGWATDIGPWYYSLRQPPWKPADAWFGPVWTTIFTLTACAAVLVWEALPPGRARQRWVVALGVNAVLNIGWSVLFFTLRQPAWALAEVVALWLSVLWLVLLAWPVRRRAALLLLPYLAWVAFAGVLNAAVVQLN